MASSKDRVLAVLVACAGMILYLGLAALGPATPERIGTFLYNHYFLALADGRLDVPARIAGLEGHYDAAGRAYVYHGLAPLVTRLLAWPFVDLTRISLAPVTIWSFTTAGTAVYHATAFRIAAAHVAPDARARTSLLLLLGAMVWAVSPGPLLVANEAVFHEPLAVAYFTSAGVVALLAEVAVFGAAPSAVLVPCALLAGITVHARPNMAVGLYAGVCLMSLFVLRDRGRAGLGRVAAAMAILFLFGAALLGFNEMRFGNMLRLHGSAEHGILEYGYLFWGVEEADSPRLQALAEHGTFHPGRVLPNLMLYLIDVPYAAPADRLMAAFRGLTEGLGRIRVEPPRIGLIFLWVPWVVLAGLGLRRPAAGSRYGWALLVATGLGALLTASYATVTLRYRVDLWPLLAALAILGLPRGARLLAPAGAGSGRRLSGLAIAFGMGLVATLGTAVFYADQFAGEGLKGRWSFERCHRMVLEAPALEPAAVDRVCAL